YILSFTKGKPTFLVCKLWHSLCDYRRLYFSNVNGVKLMKWAKNNSCPWNEWVCAHVAKKGNLDVLMWLRKKGCPWDEGTCDFAAEGGHLHVLKWARKNGCDWGLSACISAALNGHLHILKWL